MIDRACLSLNYRCNIRCLYCYFANRKKTATADDFEFSPDEAVQIIDNITNYARARDLHKFKLGLVGSGEPLLSFQALAAIVEQAKTAAGLFSLYTITNGLTLTGEQIDFFYENRSVIELNFSLDGYRELHDHLRQGFDQTMAAILQYEKVFGEKPRLNATVTRKSWAQKEDLVGFFLENKFNRINFSIVVETSDPDLSLSRAEYDDFLDYGEARGLIMRQKQAAKGKKYDCTMFGRLCGLGRNNIFFTRAGVYPCGRFIDRPDYRLADFNSPLEEIEKGFTRLKHIKDGSCYYETVLGKET